MTRIDPDLYGRWRADSPVLLALRETTDPPPERLLQQAWRHQRMARDGLILTDGRPLRVLHPGFWNREPGPDFRAAVLQFGDEPPRSGDVEVDLTPSGWRAHTHDRNPAYAGVILHVVWTARPGLVVPVPTLSLSGLLDAPVEELADWVTSGETGLPAALAGRCQSPLGELAPEDTTELLIQAARERLRHKSEALRARARLAGWDQALWEGLFAALGYKHNPWPMRRIAELLPRLHALESVAAEDPAFLWQSRLLGAASLLPEDPRGEAAPMVRKLWDRWWRDRDALADALLPRNLWRLAGQRPANHPQRRLALAAHWLAQPGLPARLETWFADAPCQTRAACALQRILQPPPDPLWSHHWTLRSPRAKRPCPLLGPPRVTDLAVNVILPWIHARAAAGRQEAILERVNSLYLAWPPGEDNAVLRQARIRLFGSLRNRARTAAAQQGLMQIVRDFCDHSDALCLDCRFPGLVRTL